MREGESGGRGSHHKTECFCKQVQELLVARFTYVLELSYEVCYKRSFAISMIDGRSKRFYTQHVNTSNGNWIKLRGRK